VVTLAVEVFFKDFCLDEDVVLRGFGERDCSNFFYLEAICYFLRSFAFSIAALDLARLSATESLTEDFVSGWPSFDCTCSSRAGLLPPKDK
jgi:hypothetical protein